MPDRLRCHGSAGRTLGILNNCLLGVVLRMPEEPQDCHPGLARVLCQMPECGSAAMPMKRLQSVTNPDALSQPAALHTLPPA
jgi:hypothetical protein